MADVHPRAEVLTFVLLTAKRDVDQLEYPVQEVLEELFSSWRDERKADLYARLAEQLVVTGSFLAAEAVVSRCLWENQKEFPHG